MHSTLKLTRHIHSYDHDIEREITRSIFLRENDFSEARPQFEFGSFALKYSLPKSRDSNLHTYQMSLEYFSTRIGYLTTLKKLYIILLLPDMFSLFFIILYLLFSQKHQPIFFRKSFWAKSYLFNFKKLN